MGTLFYSDEKSFYFGITRKEKTFYPDEILI